MDGGKNQTSQTVPELLSDGDTRYLVGHDTLGWTAGAGWTYALPDALGSVRQEVDAAGALLDARAWTPYGVEVGEAQPGLGYTGEWFDAVVGLEYLRARWYDAGTGRFTSEDLWEGNTQKPLTLNAYGYVLADPTNLVDPSGLRAVEDVLAWGCGPQKCTTHPIIEYIMARIREDSTSAEIKEIHELNETHYYEDAWVECQNRPWWQRLFICPQYLEDQRDMDVAARNRALVKFGCLVADARTRPICGQWDYKVEIGEREDLGYNAQRIDFCAIGINEEIVFYYDIWANIHFGYLGITGGFEENFLLAGATIENIGSNLGQTRDDSSDEASIRIGFHLYNSGLTQKSLLREIYLNRHRLNKARRNEAGEFEVYQ